MLNKETNLTEIKSPLLRRLFDVQLKSIERSLSEISRQINSDQSILDFGSGDYSYHHLFAGTSDYKTLDINTEADYKMLSEISSKFDIILCIEVLEHVKHPQKTISELLSKLNPTGQLIISTPLNARVHRCPKDYQRFSIDFYQELRQLPEVEEVSIRTRGHNLDTLLSKLIALYFNPFNSISNLMLAILCLPLLAFLYVINFLNLKGIANDDPLGFVVVIKPKKA